MIEGLLEQMTIEEKIAQLGCVWSTQLVDGDEFSPLKAAEKLRHGTGHVTRIGASTGLRPRESAAFMNAIQRHLVEETRLGIPALVHEESTAGFLARDADQFPQAIGLASTWDPELIRSLADVIRQQMLAVGARQTLAPVIDVARDPRWGRVEETYGEDPYLASRLGVAYVQGIQGPRGADGSLRQGVAATAKHFLGYGTSEGGHNHKPAHIGARELREVYARPFLATIQEAGLASVMNAYNEIDGLPCGGSKEILDDLLRDELGFDGVVVADYFTTMLLIHSHRVAADKGDAGQMALEAGLDMELPQTDCYAELVQRVKSGALAEDVVDRSVRRVLALKQKLGLFDDPYVDDAAASTVYQTQRARALALEAAQKSIVLLKNDGLLPIEPSISRIAVLGPCCDDVRLLQGDYHYPAHVEIVYKRTDDDMAAIMPRSGDNAFSPGPYYPPTTTPLEGIRELVSHSTQLAHATGCDVSGDDASGLADAVAAARTADVAVVCVGGKSGLVPDCTSGEFRDAAELGLTGLQQQLVEQVIATGTPTVVVLVNGRVFGLPWIAENASALVEAWLPGEEGGRAIAQVLFGAVNPSGRLPITLPRSAGQIPIYYARRWTVNAGAAGPFTADYSDSSAEPLYPFGHGLSYTTFEYGGLRISPENPGAGEAIRIELEVSNRGERAGDEIIQLYVQDPVASVTRPIQQLAGFARVSLGAGESKRLRFTLHPSQLAFYDREMKFVVEPGEFRVRVGASSDDIRLEGSFRIGGSAHELSPRDIVPTLCEATP